MYIQTPLYIHYCYTCTFIKYYREIREKSEERREKREERREKREERSEKREERREKTEERREKREERRMKREEVSREAARGPQMRPQRSQKRSREASGPHSALSASEGGMVQQRFGPPKNTNELPRVCFPKVLKIKGCHEDGRQLDSLHIYSVPWPLR